MPDLHEDIVLSDAEPDYHREEGDDSPGGGSDGDNDITDDDSVFSQPASGSPPGASARPPVTPLLSKRDREMIDSLDSDMSPVSSPAPIPSRLKRGEPRGKAASAPGRVHRRTVVAPPARNYAKRKQEDAAPLPTPPHRHYRDDNRQAAGKPERFFDYLESIVTNPKFNNRVMVYIYRIWPIMKEKMRRCDKVAGMITPDEILQRYGAGDYNLKLNDMGFGYEAITQCTIKNVGANNLTTYPPVLDVAGLEMSHPNNASYLEFCRSRGIPLPGDTNYQAPDRKREDEEDEMANVEVTREMVGTIREQAATLATIAMREENKQDDAAQQRKDAVADTTSQAVNAVAQASRIATDITREAVNGALAMSRENQQKGDPIEQMTKLVAVIKTLSPTPADGKDPFDKILTLVETVKKSQEGYTDKLFQIMREENASLKTQLNAIQTQQASGGVAHQEIVKPPTLSEQLSEMAATKDKLREILGLDEESSPKSSWTDHIPMILQGVTVLGTVIANAMHNAAVLRTGQGTALPAPPPENILTPDQYGAVQAGMAGVAPGAVNQTPAYGQYQQQGQPQPQAVGTNVMEGFMQFLSMIEVPLTRSFQAGDSGADFASKLIELGDSGMFGRETTGQQVYDTVVEYGESLVSTVIKTHPGIWRVVGQTPQKWEKFLHEFFTAEAIWDTEDAAEAAAQDRARQMRETVGATASNPAPPTPAIGEDGLPIDTVARKRKVG